MRQPKRSVTRGSSDRRAASASKRINSSGGLDGGGDTGGAFLFADTFDVDPSKALQKITLSTNITGGSLVVLSGTLVPEPAGALLMLLGGAALLRRRR